jgi:DNA-binding transcriptional LysR family regulator
MVSRQETARALLTPGEVMQLPPTDELVLVAGQAPISLEDLRSQDHRSIRFSTMLGAKPSRWEYPDGDTYATLQLPSTLHVNSAQTYEAAALAGLGLIQAPLLGIGPYLESGALVEILPDFRRGALPMSLVVAHRSNLSRRVRAFMKWIEGVLRPYLE